MCYDAHGIGTDAGPRADFDFLSGIVSNFSRVPNLSYAIANGGYDWNLGGGYTEPCSDRDVAKIMGTYGGEPVRDESNGALLYSYTDEAGSVHQLWYGDEETLRIWQTQIENQVGHPVSVCIWRA
jgi:spore germination protein YaaH